MSDYGILDQIDDVITWHGSTDAMRWTAEPPKPLLSPAMLEIDPEAAQQAFARIGEQVRAMVEAFRPVAEQVMRDVAAMAKAFAAIVNTPELQELVHARRRARSAMKSEYARRSRRRARRS